MYVLLGHGLDNGRGVEFMGCFAALFRLFLGYLGREKKSTLFDRWAGFASTLFIVGMAELLSLWL